ncbi:MAG: ImmA/IrrE family metallo-endopeptidase [Thermomicrobiales bacterium]|nr:ImmA/IrrE family metallo-endopeptidase [Thermomicrobiales bacterium]
MKTANKKDISEFAAQIADQLDCYPGRVFAPIDLPRLLEIRAHQVFGLNVEIQDLDPSVEGITIPGEPATLVFSSKMYDRLTDYANGRDRFTAAHEFGHVTMHAPQLSREYRSYNQRSSRLYRRSDIPWVRDPEWQANKFATYLLMPAWAVREVVLTTGPNAGVLADIFQVSLQAMGYRLEELGIPS